MTSINLENIGVEIPVFNAQSRSLKSKLFQIATGGQLIREDNGDVSVRAIQDVTLHISKGERVGLLGHNGAGKSTLLRVLSGVYIPTNGRATIDGEIASLIDISLGMDNESTGRENIYLRAALLGFSKKETSSIIDDVIEFSELGDFIDMPVRTYSSGMHLRLAFSVSTMVRPQILLMDEWLSVGDEKFKSKAEKRMRELVNATDIVVIASHSRKLIEDTCTRAVWLEHGRIKQDGQVSEVTSAYFSNNH